MKQCCMAFQEYAAAIHLSSTDDEEDDDTEKSIIQRIQSKERQEKLDPFITLTPSRSSVL